MNELKIFNNEEFGQVRTVVDNDNEIWFVGKDVASALGYTKLDAMYRVIDTADKLKINPQSLEFTGFPQNGATLESNPNIKILMLINESGLYQAIFNSTLPTAKEFKRWVTKEVLPSIRKTGSYSVKKIDKEELNIRHDEVQIAKSKLWLELADRVDIKEYKDLANSYAFNTLAGKNVLPLPEVKELTYSATEVGEIFGVSRNKIGILANKHNLKTDEYGKWFYDKAKNSNKEVQTFRYNRKAIEVFKELIV